MNVKIYFGHLVLSEMISFGKIFKTVPQKFANDADNLGTKFCVHLLLKLLPPSYCDPIAKCPETTKP